MPLPHPGASATHPQSLTSQRVRMHSFGEDLRRPSHGHEKARAWLLVSMFVRVYTEMFVGFEAVNPLRN